MPAVLFGASARSARARRTYDQEDVARTLPEDDERRARLLAVSDSALAEQGTIRPVIAASILGLSEKTVCAWAAAGILASSSAPRCGAAKDVRSARVPRRT